MTGLPILARLIQDKRKSLLGWTLGMVVYLAMIMALWPTIRDSEGLQQAVEDYPEALKSLLGGSAGFDYTSPAGYLNTQVFSLVLPLMWAVLGSVWRPRYWPVKRKVTSLILSSQTR